MLLKDKVCVITGAASEMGIGRHTAVLFAQHGASVAILDIDEENALRSAQSIGDDHIALKCDVARVDDCQAAVETVIERFGRVDVLVNNAGITQSRGIMDVTPEDYEMILDIHLRGTLYMSQACIPHMRQRRSGSIICMSSVSAQRGGGIFGGPHYCAAKAGIVGLCKSMARELGPDGIRVNAIAPGLINTNITHGQLTDAMKREISATVPLRRIGEPTDVAGACLFLASDYSTYITGTVIDVNGGMHIH